MIPKKIIRLIGNLLSRLTPKSRNIFLFIGTSEYRYNENTRYLFEYLLKHNPEYDLYWITKSKLIEQHVHSIGGKTINPRKLNSVITFLRAKAFFGTGQSIYNPSGLLSSKATLKINIYHASGIRQTNAGWDDNPSEKKIRNYMTGKEIVDSINQWDFVNFTSQFTNTYMGKINFLLPRCKRITLGYPRNDHLFTQTKIKNDTQKKIILYAPTWRMNQPELWFPLEKLDGFNFKDFDEFLIKENFELIVSLHPHCTIKNFPDNIKAITIINTIENPLFDINELLLDVDILLTDYSSVATDFLITQKPVIFSFIDYDDFMNERGLLLDIINKEPGFTAGNYNSLKEKIMSVDNIKDNLIIKNNIEEYLNKFYDTEISNSCERWVNFIKKVL